MPSILISKIQEYKILFEINDYRQIQINYFDNIQEFRNFIYSLRKEDTSLPKYAAGTFDNGMINAYISSNIVINSHLYKEKLYMANHELFHIMYLEIILKNDISKRIIWYDEGMAQFMSLEKDYLQDKKQFQEFYFKVKKETKEFSKLNAITHGTSFCNELYNGYDLSYLCIRYLKDTLNDNDFKALIHNFAKIV